MNPYATVSSLNYQIETLNNLLEVKVGDVGYCYLYSINISPRKNLYQLQQVINRTGAIEDFFGTGDMTGGKLSYCINAFIKGYKQAKIIAKENGIFKSIAPVHICNGSDYKINKNLLILLGHLIMDTAGHKGVLLETDEKNATVIHISQPHKNLSLGTLPISAISKVPGYDYEWRKPIIDVGMLIKELENLDLTGL
ncbi:MAG: hypothetical protein K2Q14_06060 [Gammaproteobacteria bacterium]|nr:hypothetical protein [Gammaproteobacteria bacterium]